MRIGCTLLLFSTLITAVAVAFPSSVRQQYPLYTVQKIYEVYDDNSRMLDKQPKAVKELIDTLIQVVIQQNSRLDIMEGSQTTLRTEISDISVENTYLKKFVFEKLSTYHNDFDGARSGLGRTSNRFLPWNNYFQDRTKLVVGDIVAMNDTLAGVSFKVDTLHKHLEEVEDVVREIKRNTVDQFQTIISNALPILQQRVEDRYKEIFKIPVTPEPTVGTGSQTTAGPTSHIKDGKVMSRCADCAALTQIQSQGVNFSYNVTDLNSEETNITNSSLPNMYSQEELSAMYKNCPTDIRTVRDQTIVMQLRGDRSKIVGAWMQDGYNQSSSKVWLIPGYKRLSTLLEFSNIVTFQRRTVLHSYQLPFFCAGTGHIIYNSSLYCSGFKSDKIFKYDLLTNTYNETKLKGEGVHKKYGYSIDGFNYMDMVTDSQGIWVVYSNVEAAGAIIILKLDAVTLKTQYIAYTNVNQSSAMNCFMIFGSLYAVKAKESGVGIEVTKIWSIHNSEEPSEAGDEKPISKDLDSKSITLEKTGQPQVISADYNPRYNRLYTWSLDNITTGRSSLNWIVFDLMGSREETH